jgi:ATP-dependent Lon protease
VCGNSSNEIEVKKSLLPEAVLDSKPSQSDMLEIVPMMSSEWRKVGLHLKIKVYILDNISKNQRDKVEDCCLQMCREWLEKKKGTGEVERNWRSLLDCVEKVYGPESRRDIEKELKDLPTSSKS